MIKFCFILLYMVPSVLSASAAETENIYYPILEEQSSRKRQLAAESEESLHSSDAVSPPPRMRGRFDSPLLPQRPRFIITLTQREKMNRAGLDNTTIDKVVLLSTALLRSPHGTPSRIDSYFSPSEINAITRSLDGIEEFTIMLRWLKTVCPEKVLRDQSNIFSPAVRTALSRKQATRRRSFYHVAESLAEEGMPIRSLAPSFFIEEDEADTETERAERRVIQERLFTDSESVRGIKKEDRHRALMDEETSWAPFVYYFRQRTLDIDSKGLSCKITQHEINEVFQRFLSDYYTSMTVDDCIVYLRLADIDLDRTNVLGETNRELLARGVAPIGVDGKSMNMHHLTRRHPGALVLLTESFHQKYTDILHLRSERHMRQPKPLDRRSFNLWKLNAFRILEKYFSEPSAADPSHKATQ